MHTNNEDHQGETAQTSGPRRPYLQVWHEGEDIANIRDAPHMGSRRESRAYMRICIHNGLDRYTHGKPQEGLRLGTVEQEGYGLITASSVE